MRDLAAPLARNGGCGVPLRPRRRHANHIRLRRLVARPLGRESGDGCAWRSLERRASRRGVRATLGVLVKSSRQLELLAAVRTIAMDKTGTLTEGRFRFHRMVEWSEAAWREDTLPTASLHGCTSVDRWSARRPARRSGW